MAHSQTNSSVLIEIQTLKEELDSSKKTVAQYASLIAKLSVELENLRSSICQACKKKLVADISAPSTNSGSPGSSSSKSIHSGKSQHRSRFPVNITSARSSPNRLVIPGPISNTVSSRPAAVAEPTTTITVGGADERTTNSPEWPVIHNPIVKKALDLHLAHIFTYESRVSCVKMSPDGKSVAIGLFEEGKTYINEVTTGSKICVFVDRYRKDPLDIWDVQFSPDGQLVATASENQIRVWDITQRRMRAMFRGHALQINSITFSPDGHYLVSGSSDSIRIWNIREGSSKELAGSAGWFLDVAFSPDGRYIATANHYSLRIWDARTTKLITRWQGHTSHVWCVKFTPDGKGLMSGSVDHTLKYWDASPLGIHQARSWKGVVPGQSLREIRRFEGHDDAIRSIAFFPRNNRWIVSSSTDGSVRIWDLETGIWQLRLQGRANYAPEVDVSRTETILATEGHCVMLWKFKELQV